MRKFYRHLSQDLTLYLVWDSESETSKEGTILTTRMSVHDEDSDSPGHKPGRKKRKKSESSQSSSESSESEDDEATP